ncbi:hypothetical protein ABL849_19920 [Variovorax sp. 375MFSha3.1]|uniref:Uncharacterized protein n=1 Tax=Variovorax guangxiensis TaxID=1775474 RepID=A0A840FIU6_9BURK|nr:hypothetical protein [Variovorax guangxiensis]MBB4220912.1 hypothetical protein [Variovorax guangxiensis]
MSKDELAIYFDGEGADLLLSKISELLDGKGNVEHVGCLRLLRGDPEEAMIELRLNVLDRLEMKNNSLLLDMSSDALEYAFHQLSEFLRTGYFFPSEFWSFSREGRKYDTQVFFGKLTFVKMTFLTPA